MSAPAVSILVPAFRPDWLDLALASALAQTHADFELLVSDDSDGDAIEAIVSKWRDPRLRYFRNPRRGEPGANRNLLLQQARGDYLKFLFDDDFLLPRSVETLLQAAREHRAAMVFHHRCFVDRNGRPLGTPTAVPAGTTAVIEPRQFFEQLIGRSVNLIGEPTNILLHAATLRALPEAFSLDGRRMRFLTDMALYTDLFARGHRVVGVGDVGSAFRQHDGQASGSGSPGLSAGCFEWELLRRWSVDAGQLGRDAYRRGVPTLQQMYESRVADYPELQSFIAMGGECDAPRLVSPGFEDALSVAYATIELRRLNAVESKPRPALH